MVLAAIDCQLAGRYQLCRRLAVGGMGQVWQAVDQALDRPVAVKLPRDDARDPRFVMRLRAEARHAAAVSHPGIAGVFDYGETTAGGAGPTAYLVMELVDGEPLSALLARQGRRGCNTAWGLSGRRPWRWGRRIRLGWCTATSNQGTCWSARTAW
jgi:serine/threonine protein kinase